MSWPHHRARPSGRRRRPPPPASKPPPRARPRSALSLRWRPPPGPWRSTSRSWSSTRPQTSNSKVGWERAADLGAAGGRRDLGWVGGRGKVGGGPRVSVPSPTPRHFPFSGCARLLSPTRLSRAGPAPSLARLRLGARAGRGEAEGPGPGAAAAILRSRGGASRVLSAPLPAPGTCPWPPRAVGRCLRGCGWAVTLERALWSAAGRGALGGGASASVAGAGCQRRWEGRRGSGAAALDLVPRENHSSASSRGWVEPALGPRRRGCCLPFYLV